MKPWISYDGPDGCLLVWHNCLFVLALAFWNDDPKQICFKLTDWLKSMPFPRATWGVNWRKFGIATVLVRRYFCNKNEMPSGLVCVTCVFRCKTQQENPYWVTDQQRNQITNHTDFKPGCPDVTLRSARDFLGWKATPRNNIPRLEKRFSGTSGVAKKKTSKKPRRRHHQFRRNWRMRSLMGTRTHDSIKFGNCMQLFDWFWVTRSTF